MMRNYENNNYLSANVRTAMFQNPELGVCVLYKDNKFKRWSTLQLRDSDFSKNKLASMILDGQMSDFEEEFVVIDQDGNVCATNAKDKTSVDGFGIVHIENDKMLVKPLAEGVSPQFVSAKNMHELNRKILYLVKAKQVKRPDGFGTRGYPEEPASASQPNF